MAITSLTFAGFVLLVLIFYYALPRRPQNVLLLAASYVFYATWSWWYLIVLWALTAANFALALRVRREGVQRRRWMWIGIGVNLLALAIFKYEHFFVPDLRVTLDRWGVDTGIGGLDVLLPVGMSFYVLGAISYLIDVARGQVEAARDLVDFALYMAYFPKLLAGPIERARAFLPRLAAPRVVDNEVMTRALTRIVIGLVRKIVIADALSKAIPVHLWNGPGSYSASELALYLMIYAVALYNDFAGYTSIVRGVSGLLGIEMASNFNAPYFARNASEFWNRWHITLSQWLRDYIYYPTSRALLRRNPHYTNIPNLIVPPMITMLASGAWHGTGWGMLLWGGLHGVYLVAERLFSLWKPAGPPRLQPRWRQGIAMLIMFWLVMLAWVPFRVGDLATTLDYWSGMADWSGPLHWPSLLVLLALIPPLWIDWVQYRHEDDLIFLRWPRLVQAALLAVALLAIFLSSQSRTTVPFVYQGF